MRLVQIGFLLIAIGLFGAQAVAEELQPDASDSFYFLDIPPVTGASKFKQEVADAPSSISIVTADEIKRFRYRTIADVLAGARGFYATNDLNYQYAGARGFSIPGDYNTRLLVVIDGVPAQDSLSQAAGIGYDFPVDLALIDHIELIRGPGSALYGSGAFFGVINVITRKGRHIRGLEVEAGGGSYQSYSGRITYGQRFDNSSELLLSADGLQSNGRENIY